MIRITNSIGSTIDLIKQQEPTKEEILVSKRILSIDKKYAECNRERTIEQAVRMVYRSRKAAEKTEEKDGYYDHEVKKFCFSADFDTIAHGLDIRLRTALGLEDSCIKIISKKTIDDYQNQLHDAMRYAEKYGGNFNLDRNAHKGINLLRKTAALCPKYKKKAGKAAKKNA